MSSLFEHCHQPPPQAAALGPISVPDSPGALNPIGSPTVTHFEPHRVEVYDISIFMRWNGHKMEVMVMKVMERRV